MVRIITKSGLAVACLLALAVFVPPAHAGAIDFSCGGVTACTGTVTSSGGLGFSTTGIGLGSNFDGMFTATFSTNSSGTGSMTMTASDGDSLSGTIAGTSESSFGGHETLVFNVTWTTMSPAVEAALGSTNGVGQSTVQFLVSSGSVVSADFSVTPSPTPEPSTLLLLGTGLLGVGLALRRHAA